MSLDQNLFTLSIVPQPKDANVLDLVDPSGTAHYRKLRVAGTTYQAEVYDPSSESLLASVTAPSATSKTKIIELHNPSVPVELKFTGTISFRWAFKWEDHEFEWKREECFMLRKPDPPVLVAITKDPPGKIKPKSVQILDYNLNRFDINDRKGLEIVLLTALLSFADSSDEYHKPLETSVSTSPPTTRNPSNSEAAPTLPPKPVRTGVELIAEMQTGEPNEVLVEEEGSFKDYAQYCANLLQGDNMLFITISSSAPATVPKVLQVVEQTKRIRHKAGEEEDLHQYVLYNTDTPTSSAGRSNKKGPKVIKLDDAVNKDKGKEKYEPPNNLRIHLSKIPMPELQPKAKLDAASKSKQQQIQSGKVQGSKDEKAKPEKAKPEKVKSEKQKGKSSTSGRPSGSKPPDIRSTSQSPPRTSSHPNAGARPAVNKLSKPVVRPDWSQVHLPSPANNHANHAAPPPPPPRPYPATSTMPQPIFSAHPHGPPSYPGSASPHEGGALQSHPYPSYSGTLIPPPPLPPSGQRPVTPSMVTGLLDRLKTW